MRYAVDTGVYWESRHWRPDNCAVAGLAARVSLSVYGRYVLGVVSNESVGWDPVSIFGRFWVIGIPLLIFCLGCSAGFWFLSKRLHR